MSDSIDARHLERQRQEYELTEVQLAELLDACKPTPVISITNPEPPGPGVSPVIDIGGDPQQNANRAWQKLADELGFVWDTVRPVPGKSQRFFSALPAEVSP